jgi:mevalonate kinase
MRFGRKLALALEAEKVSGVLNRHYISHKELKQILANASKARKDGNLMTASIDFIQDFIRIVSDDILRINQCLSNEIENVHQELMKLVHDTRTLGMGDGGTLSTLIEVFRKVCRASKI